MELEFEDTKKSYEFKSREVLGQATRPRMLDLILKTGLVKDEKGAGTVLITITLLIFVLSIFIFVMTSRDSKEEIVPIRYVDGTFSPIN